MKKFTILIPVFNDWKSVLKLLEKIDLEIMHWNAEISVLVINDASTEEALNMNFNFKKIKSICIIDMKKNQGHARCNATGLKYLIEKESFDYVILMDADGEDRPEELSSLFNKSIENPSSTITANRIKRSEGPFFKLLYECHKILTYIFTGELIKFGNYSCLPRSHVMNLLKEPSIWSSFSGAVVKVISNRMSVSSIRGQRYFLPSKMNLLNLIIHSFSIIAVFRKTVIIRSIIFLFIYLFFISYNISVITLSPVFIVLLFIFSIFKISLRSNIDELNSCLKNISSTNVLNGFNNR